MAAIRTSCPECGDIGLTTRDVTVVYLDRPHGAYRYRCPRCYRIVMKEAEPRTLELLVSSGCEQRTIGQPREVHPSGGPLTHDDLLDFRQGLYDHDTFNRAVRDLT